MSEERARIEVVAPPRFENTDDKLADVIFGSNDKGRWLAVRFMTLM